MMLWFLKGMFLKSMLRICWDEFRNSKILKGMFFNYIMSNQSLVKYAEYNELITDVYSKLKFSPYRNNLNIFWLRSSRKVLNNAIDQLLRLNIWTTNEIKLLNKLKSLTKIKSKDVVTISVENVSEIINLSIESLIERDNLVQEEVYENKRYMRFKEALYLLGANKRLLEIIKLKIANSSTNQKDINSLNIISHSLFQSYLFIAGKIKEKIYLEESLKDVKEIWRNYHPLEKIEVV